MSRRPIAAVVALVLAAGAAAVVINYVSGADERAMAGMSPTSVFVVSEPVPEGTPSEDLTEYLTVAEVPTAAVVPGGVQDLDEVAGQVTTAALQAGEQLLAARFAPPEEEAEAFQVPEGFHQVSVQLPANRVIGGHLVAGDTVGIFISDEDETHLRLHKVLVTRVHGGATINESDDGEEQTQEASSSLMVTFAVSAPDAEILVNAAEFRGIWLSLEPADAPEGDTRVVDREDLLP
ncbi:Flp pilus assembly protein CpaB [Pseudactinotalea sp. Z1739]|uniref:Flp pilus assembly protein CpaB n=1 Tax=Pseudactinotalea sp. Z1739 TaxID=3413028 RepID=UPI003C7DE3F5